MDSLEKLAAATRKAVKPCGTIKVWGSHLVRPGDQIYDLVDVKADGKTLRIKLHLAMDNSDVQIDVEEPEGGKVAKGGLTVQGAKRVRAFGTEFTQPAGAKEPALILGL